jgi:hypothetical protein
MAESSFMSVTGNFLRDLPVCQSLPGRLPLLGFKKPFSSVMLFQNILLSGRLLDTVMHEITLQNKRNFIQRRRNNVSGKMVRFKWNKMACIVGPTPVTEDGATRSLCVSDVFAKFSSKSGSE